eukprot:1388619-Amphidinium_carterae.1
MLPASSQLGALVGVCAEKLSFLRHRGRPRAAALQLASDAHKTAEEVVSSDLNSKQETSRWTQRIGVGCFSLQLLQRIL